MLTYLYKSFEYRMMLRTGDVYKRQINERIGGQSGGKGSPQSVEGWSLGEVNCEVLVFLKRIFF